MSLPSAQPVEHTASGCLSYCTSPEALTVLLLNICRYILTVKTFFKYHKCWYFDDIWYFVVLITIEGEVAKDGSQQVHDKHGQNRDIRNVLHAFLAWTEITRRQKDANVLIHLKCE